MKLKLLFFLILFCFGKTLNAQILYNYEKVKTVDRVMNTHNLLAFDMVISKDKTLLAICFWKPGHVEVYDTENWKTVGDFPIKGLINQTDSYFSGTEENIIHLAKNKGRTMYKVNFKTKEVTTYKVPTDRTTASG